MKITKLFFIAICATLLSGCVAASFYPCYTDASIIQLPEIAGSWERVNPEGADGKVIRPWIFTKDKVTAYDEDGKTTDLSVIYFKADDQTFCDVSSLEDVPLALNVHLLCKVDMNDGKLKMTLLDVEWARDKIDKKEIKLSYLSRTGGWLKVEEILFTSPPPEWENFLRQFKKDEQAFPSKYAYLFEKRMGISN